MLSRDGARLQAFLELRRCLGDRRGWDEIIILDEWMIERPWGWVARWKPRRCWNGDLSDVTSGGGPVAVLVNRHDGSMRLVGTGRPLDESIQAYEVDLERAQETWELVVNESATCSVTIAAGLRSALGLSLVDLEALRKRLPCVIKAGARVDLEPTLNRLDENRISAEIRLAARPESNLD